MPLGLKGRRGPGHCTVELSTLGLLLAPSREAPCEGRVMATRLLLSSLSSGMEGHPAEQA